MSRVLAISGLILAIAIIGIDASALPAEKTINATVVVVTKDQMDKLLQDYPNAVPLTRKSVKPEERDDIIVLVYTLGKRVFSDELVSYNVGYHTWIDYRNIDMKVIYPSIPGTGAIVTHVYITVVQASNSGRGYVLDGGVGYRYITILIEADNTNRFDYTTNIYGIR